MCKAKHDEITQNNKFAISLQYRKKEVSDEVYFLHSCKHENFLRVDTIIFDGNGQAFSKFPNRKFAMSLQHLKKEVRDEVDFLHTDKHQSFLQVDFNTLDIKVSYRLILLLLLGMIKHSQSTQSNKFAISLQKGSQNLKKKSICAKKKVRIEFRFCMQINIKVPASWNYRF